MFLTRDLPATSKGSVSHLLLFRPRDRILGLNILLLCTVPPTHLGTIGQTPERPQLWPTKMPPAMVFPGNLFACGRFRAPRLQLRPQAEWLPHLLSPLRCCGWLSFSNRGDFRRAESPENSFLPESYDDESDARR